MSVIPNLSGVVRVSNQNFIYISLFSLYDTCPASIIFLLNLLQEINIEAIEITSYVLECVKTSC
jgi:hypothetical protein